MQYASDFRRIARDSLSGKWTIAVIVGLIASLLGAISYNGPEFEFTYNDNGANISLNFANQQIYSSQNGVLPEISDWIVGGVVYLFMAAIVLAVALFVLGNIIRIGYAKFNLELVDRQKEPELNALFGYFSYWKTVTVASLLQSVYVLLWSLLFIIPGIIASYSYTMTGYILAENPELTASEAIEQSKQMMSGNRWRLFCLQFSFIGWSILASLTLGIGNLWLTPYRQAAEAAFYREVSGTERVLDNPLPIEG